MFVSFLHPEGILSVIFYIKENNKYSTTSVAYSAHFF